MLLMRKHTSYIFPEDLDRKKRDDELLAEGVKSNWVFSCIDTSNGGAGLDRVIIVDPRTIHLDDITEKWETSDIWTGEKPINGTFPLYFLRGD